MDIQLGFQLETIRVRDGVGRALLALHQHFFDPIVLPRGRR
jgi:hypothetical protein